MDKVKVLVQFLPEAAAPVVSHWIDSFNCEFKIARNRSTKLGDFRPPFGGRGHRISVNRNLNPYAFLVTTVHEFAHLVTWNEHQRKAKPHGKEWKLNFRKMMEPFFELDIFPADINDAIIRYLDNPAASSCTDLNLYRSLQQYDRHLNAGTHVELLEPESIFTLKNGKVFKKGERIRKRYRCTELKTGLIYLFSPIAEVFPVEKQA